MLPTETLPMKFLILTAVMLAFVFFTKLETLQFECTTFVLSIVQFCLALEFTVKAWLAILRGFTMPTTRL